MFLNVIKIWIIPHYSKIQECDQMLTELKLNVTVTDTATADGGTNNNID